MSISIIGFDFLLLKSAKAFLLYKKLVHKSISDSVIIVERKNKCYPIKQIHCKKSYTKMISMYIHNNKETLLCVLAGFCPVCVFLGLHNDPVSGWLPEWPCWRRCRSTDCSLLLVACHVLDSTARIHLRGQGSHTAVDNIFTSATWCLSR